MSYPSASTTTILPVSGTIRFSQIASLSGNKGASIGTASKPYRLSEFAGQDYDIPNTSKPVRFSNFYGAINYNYNYLLYLNSGLSTGVQDTDLFYYDNSKISQAPYKAKSLGNISRMLKLQTKETPNILTTDTFALKSATLNASWQGILDDSVSLWMQINNQTYSYTSKQLSTQQLTITNATFNSFIQTIETGLDITIAPEIVKSLQDTLVINPFSKTNSDNFYLAKGVNDVIAKLNNYLKTLGGAKLYSIGGQNATSKNFTFSISTYSQTTAPLCYLLGYAYEPRKGQNFASKSITVNLSNYPIQLGYPVNLYMGPGPTTPASGRLWGVGGSMTLSINIVNTPLITVT